MYNKRNLETMILQNFVFELTIFKNVIKLTTFIQHAYIIIFIYIFTCIYSKFLLNTAIKYKS